MGLLLKIKCEQKTRRRPSSILFSFFLIFFCLTSAHSAERFALLSVSSPNTPTINPSNAKQKVSKPQRQSVRFGEDCLNVNKTGCIRLLAPVYTDKKPKDISTAPPVRVLSETDINALVKPSAVVRTIPIRMVRESQEVQAPLVKNAAVSASKKKNPVFHLIMLGTAVASFILTNRFLPAKTFMPGRLKSNRLTARYLKPKIMKTGGVA